MYIQFNPTRTPQFSVFKIKIPFSIQMRDVAIHHFGDFFEKYSILKFRSRIVFDNEMMGKIAEIPLIVSYFR